MTSIKWTDMFQPNTEKAIRDAVEKGGGVKLKSAFYQSVDVMVAAKYFYHDRAILIDEGGHFHRVPYSDIFLTPYFWEALGKFYGWPANWAIHQSVSKDDVSGSLWLTGCPAYWQHKFIDHVRAGSSVEDFFAKIV